MVTEWQHVHFQTYYSVFRLNIVLLSTGFIITITLRLRGDANQCQCLHYKHWPNSILGHIGNYVFPVLSFTWHVRGQVSAGCAISI